MNLFERERIPIPREIAEEFQPSQEPIGLDSPLVSQRAADNLALMVQAYQQGGEAALESQFHELFPANASDSTSSQK